MATHLQRADTSFIKGVIAPARTDKHTLAYCPPSAVSVSPALQEGSTSLFFFCHLSSIFPVLYHTLPQALSVSQQGQAAGGGWGGTFGG